MASVASVAPQSTSDFQQPAANADGSAAEANQQYSNQATMQHGGSYQKRSTQMSCLYTKQKTQKRKTWHDGRLVLHSMGASLYDAHPPPGSGDPKLDECCLTRSQCDALIRQTETRLETDKFLVQVEGPWTVSAAPTALAKPTALVSAGMKKVIGRKFQKPGAFKPRHPMQEQQQNQPPAMRKRQRQPLQPGELQRRHYGEVVPQQMAPAPAAPPAWNQGLQQQQQHQGPQMLGNPPNGRRAVHFQGSNGAQQQPPPNQMAPRYENRIPQPPFQQGRQPPLPVHQQSGPSVAPNGGYNTAPVRQPYDTTPTGPPPQQHVTEPPRNSTLSTMSDRNLTAVGQGANSFVGNQFNASQFYGEDEELSQEEEDDDGGGLGWNMQQVPRNTNIMQDTSSHTAIQPQEASSNKQGASGETAPQGSVQAASTTNANNGNSSALSTNELLQLFGASPAPAAEETKEDDKPAASDSQQPPEKESSFELVLPAAPDSSSDDDSDDEEEN